MIEILNLVFPSGAAVISITLLGVSFGLILSIAKIKLHVDKDPRIEKIGEILPGANCGACGLPGCSAYATKIVEDKYDIDLCPVGGSEVAMEIAKVMGMDVSDSIVAVKARVHCQGGIVETAKKFIYNGAQDCTAANALIGGYKICSYGCLGFGDCVRACPFDAIHMGDNGLPVVDWEKCVGCGKCADACPRSIISMVPEKFEMHVKCKNKEKAPIMKKGCTVGCIGCMLCVKACKENFVDDPNIESAIVVENFCAVIDYNICTNCYKCVEVCPVPVIHPIERSKKYQKNKAAEKEKAGASV